MKYIGRGKNLASAPKDPYGCFETCYKAYSGSNWDVALLSLVVNGNVYKINVSILGYILITYRYIVLY